MCVCASKRSACVCIASTLISCQLQNTEGVHLSFLFSSREGTPPSQTCDKHWKCEQRQSFWCQQGQKAKPFICARGFVISLRGICSCFQGCSVMNKVGDERSQCRAKYTQTIHYTLLQYRSPAAKDILISFLSWLCHMLKFMNPYFANRNKLTEVNKGRFFSLLQHKN